MARDSRSVEDELRPLVDRFVAQLARVLERHVTQDLRRRVLEEVRGRVGDGGRRAGSSRPVIKCYFPGCQNVAAPRFGMFCAATHKGLSAAAKAKYRARHDAR
jgi:hypothetical protein